MDGRKTNSLRASTTCTREILFTSGLRFTYADKKKSLE
jgi:hypothetical protein